MKLIDKKGKLFGVVNILDLFILLMVLAFAAGGIYLYKTTKTEQEYLPTEKIEFDIEFKGISMEKADAIKIGQSVTETRSGITLGTIFDKNVKESVEIVKDIDKGKFVKTIIPEKYDVTISLNADAAIQPDTINISGWEIKIGKPVYVKFSIVSSGFVTAIRLQ